MKFQNAERLKRRLAAMPRMARIEIREAMEQSAREIVAMMKRMVPVDTGRLRESIAWTWGNAPAGAVVLLQSDLVEGQMRITIFAGVRGGYDQGWYVRFVEFGTVKMAARPFFFPGWRLGRKRAVGRINRAASRAAKKVAAKA